MKKLYIFLAVVLIIVITGCSGGGSDTPTPSAQPVVELMFEPDPPAPLVATGDLTIQHYESPFARGLRYESYAPDGRIYTGTLDQNGDFLGYAGVTRFFKGQTYLGQTGSQSASLTRLFNFSTDICPEHGELDIAKAIAGDTDPLLDCLVAGSSAMAKAKSFATSTAQSVTAQEAEKAFNNETEVLVAMKAFKAKRDQVTANYNSFGVDEATYSQSGLPGGHAGIDLLSSILPRSLYSISDGEIVKTDPNWGAVFVLSHGAQRDFIISYLHLSLASIQAIKLGPILSGDYIGEWSGRGKVKETGLAIDDRFKKHLHIEIGPDTPNASFSSNPHIFSNTSGTLADMSNVPLSNTYTVLRSLVDPTFGTPSGVSVSNVQFPYGAYAGLDSRFSVTYSGTVGKQLTHRFAFSPQNSTALTECAYDHPTQLGSCRFPSDGIFIVKAISLADDSETDFYQAVTTNTLEVFSVSLQPICIRAQNQGVDVASGSQYTKTFNVLQPAAYITTNRTFSIQKDFQWSAAFLPETRYFPILLRPGYNYLSVATYRSETNSSEFRNFKVNVDASYCDNATVVTPSPINISLGSPNCPNQVWIDTSPLAQGRYYYYSSENYLMPVHLGTRNDGGFIKGYFSIGGLTDWLLVGMSDSSATLTAIGYSRLIPPNCSQ